MKIDRPGSHPFHRHSVTDVRPFFSIHTMNKSDSNLHTAIAESTLNHHHTSQQPHSSSHSPAAATAAASVRRTVSSREASTSSRHHQVAPATSSVAGHVTHMEVLDDSAAVVRRRALHRRRITSSSLACPDVDDVHARGADGDVTATPPPSAVTMATTAPHDTSAAAGAASHGYDDEDCDTTEQFMLERAKCRQERLQMLQKKCKKRQPGRYESIIVSYSYVAPIKMEQHSIH